MAAEAHEQPGGQPGALLIALLGGFHVTVAGRAIGAEEWPRRRAGDLVKLLALAPGYHVHAEQAMEQFWPEAGAEAAARNLQQALHRARRVLEPGLARGSASAYMRRTAENVLYLAAPGGVWVDLDGFRASRAAAGQSGAVADLAAAAARYAGDLLPRDTYADWTIRPREQLREAYLDVLAELAGRYEEQHRFADAIETLLRLVETEPAHEDARAHLMRLHARAGRRYHALRQYQQLRHALRRELDAEPSPATRRLYVAIRAGALPADGAASVDQPADSDDGWTPPLSDPSPATSRMPDSTAHAGESQGERFATSFIGRSREIEAVTRLLETERLVTLRGAGGSGKTRLAERVAFGLQGAYEDGVSWVELASLADGRLVAQTVATALGIRPERGRPLPDTLVHALASRELLLVLDNCEHLVKDAAALATAVLSGCPRVRILATSRRPLHLAQERDWRVPAMAAPDPDDLPPFELLGEYDAIRLCITRAAAHRPGFALTPRNGPAVVRICARLDGIPLAIELAAARLRLLSADEVAARLDDVLVLLASGDATRPPRQRTLRATLDWSHGLLGADERILLRRLAVFVGGWSPEAAEAVCAGDGIEVGQVLCLLERLADASLVVVEECDGHSRYRLLEMVRRYAREQLEASGDRDRVSRRHAEWYLALEEQAAPLLYDRGQDAWRARVALEHDNARAALRWAARAKEVTTGLRLGGALRRFWYLNNLLDEGRRWLDELLGHAGDDRGAEPAALATAQYSSGLFAHYQGDFARAEAHAERCLALFQSLGDPGGTADAYTLLGDVAFDQGRYERAIDLHGQCLALCEAAGDAFRAAIACSNLGDVAAAQGDIARAVQFYTECLTRSRRLNDWRKITIALVNLGKMAARRGESARATALLEEALALNREIGERRGEAEVLVPLGALACQQGDYDLAHMRYAEALTLYVAAGNSLGTAQAVEGLAQTADQRNEPARAARLHGAASALRERLGAPLPPAQAPGIARGIAALKATLGARTFAEAWTRGAAAPLDRIVAEVAETQCASRGEVRRPPRADISSQPLTRREREVTELVARGFKDKEIGAALKISERTASKHIGNILRKVGLASRDALGRWWCQTQAPADL